MQQLQVVDDDKPDALLPLQPPCAGAQRRNGQRRGIVDKQRQFLQLAAGARKLAEIFAANFAHPQQFGTDPRLFGQDTRCQLIRRHFQTEERHFCADALIRWDAVFLFTQPPLRRVERDIGYKRGFAHARTPGQYHKIAVMQAANLGIDAVQARGDARQVAARLQRLFHVSDRFGGCRQEAFHAARFAFAFGNFIQRGFRRLNLSLGIDILAGVERVFNQSATNADQFAQQRQIVYLLRKIPRA